MKNIKTKKDNKAKIEYSHISKLYVEGFFILLISFVIVFGMTIFRSNQSYRKQMSGHITQISGVTTNYLIDVFDAHLSSIEMSSDLYGTSLESADANLKLLAKIENNTSFDWIRFIDKNGIDYASDGATAICYDREYFKNGMKGLSGIDVVLQSRINNQKLIGFYAPVRYKGEIAGILVGFLNEDTISRILKSDIDGYPVGTYIVQNNGVVIGQNKASQNVIIDNVYDVYYRIGNENERTAADNAVKNASDASFTYSGNYGKSIGCIYPIAGTEWTLLQLFPSEVFSNAQKDMNLGYIILFLIIVIVIFITSFLFGKASKYETELGLEDKIREEREKGRVDLQLIVAAARTVYPFIMSQNLSRDYVKIHFNDTQNQGKKTTITIDQMSRDVLSTIPDEDSRERFAKNFSRNALLDTYYSGVYSLKDRVRQIHPDGVHWVEVTVILLEGEDKDIYAVSMTRFIDDEIARQNELENAKMQADIANKAKSDFLASMSHEIRTPINAILGMDTMIIRESNQEEIRQYAIDASNAGKTLLTLVNDILDFSKIESGKMEILPNEYAIDSMIADLVNMVKGKAASKGLQLKVNINPQTPVRLYGDDLKIRQIILNLLNNAVKYTNEGTIELHISFANKEEDSILLEVSVRDTGIGIKKEDMDKLFLPFVRIDERLNANEEGTGLGISITRNLLELMGSRLTVISDYGKGSTFSFTITQKKVGDDVIGDLEERLNSNVSTGMNQDELFTAPDAKLLIVDDVDMNLIVASHLLKRTEVKITTCSSGPEAIDIAREEHFDIIFIDAMMPGMDGVQTLDAIRKECLINKNTTCVCLTANAISGSKEKYIAEGFDDYLSKPIDSVKLEKMVKKYLSDDLIVLKKESDDANFNEDSVTLSESDEIMDALNQIDEISVQDGVRLTGGIDAYYKICENFSDTSNMRIGLLEEYYNEKDINAYTIQVHALKSSSRIIGAQSLSDKAYELEMAGKNNDLVTIDEIHPTMIADYKNIADKLSNSFKRVYSKQGAMSDMELISTLTELREAIEVFDYDVANMIVEHLNNYDLPLGFENKIHIIKENLAAVNRTELLKELDDFLN